MFNLAIYMYTSEIITTSMLLLYTHLRNVECGVQHNNSRRWFPLYIELQAHWDHTKMTIPLCYFFKEKD